MSVDYFTVPTTRFQVLYVFLVLAHERRRILHFGVTAHPTAEWTAQQPRDVFPWDTTPRYLPRDYDRIFGDEFTKQVKDMGIQEVLSAPRSPWQRAYASHCTSSVRFDAFDSNRSRSESFPASPCILRGAFSPGCSYKHSPLSLYV